jgi:hypothetical protein
MVLASGVVQQQQRSSAWCRRHLIQLCKMVCAGMAADSLLSNAVAA